MKPRRDITLGEMQDECNKHYKNDDGRECATCPMNDVCQWVGRYPHDWDLTDPPRFNEQQMAFWRGMHEIGVAKVVHLSGNGNVYGFYPSGDGLFFIATIYDERLSGMLEAGETLDLAELLGKDAT